LRSTPCARIRSRGSESIWRVHQGLAAYRLGVLHQLGHRIRLTGNRWRRRDYLGDTRVERSVEPDMRVQSQRSRNLVAEVGAEAFAGDAPDHLAHQPSERDRVITVPRARLPPRLLPGQFPRYDLPTEKRFVG